MLSPRPLRNAAALPAGVLAGSLTESEASRRVYLTAGGLGLLGLLLLVGTVWWWRSTRSEHPSLAPLEVMGARRWRKANEPERQRLVDGVRPEGAQTGPAVIEPEPVDLAALAVGDHAGFDDLREIDELLGLDVEQLLALRPQPAPAAGDGSDADAASDAGAALAVDEVPDDVDQVDDETVAITPDDDEDVPAEAVDVDEPVVQADELDDEADDEAELGDEAAELGDDAVELGDDAAELGDDAVEEPTTAPGDPLLERSANE